jgi:tRNA pseudouridine65 synthase
LQAHQLILITLLRDTLLEIIFRDDDIIAINKPHGLLVHRSRMAAEANTFALQLLRDQIDQHVYPVHRLDRKTSGVLLFALNKSVLSAMNLKFSTHEIDKTYLAIVRGYFPENIVVDHPLTNDSGKTQESITHFKLLKTTELPLPFGMHSTSRYSLIEARPKTGRMHQIRKHCNHLRHPIIGDRPHGCNKQNKFFNEHWNMNTMMLHASELSFDHPTKNKKITITAGLHSEFNRMKTELNL